MSLRIFRITAQVRLVLSQALEGSRGPYGRAAYRTVVRD
jgi:hypothetical protein